MCEIVKYLHALDIYALDLKPDHIRNNNNKIFLIDWYEKSYGAQWGDPHRLFVNGEPSKSEDIYAIGNLIYFYITGKHPFSSNNPLQSLYMMRKSKPHSKGLHPYLYRGFFHCVCGCFITTERQKGNNYLRCTKRKNPCDQRYVREDIITSQIKEEIKKVSLPDDWAKWMIAENAKDRQSEVQSSTLFVQNTKEK